MEADPRVVSELRGPRWIVYQGITIRVETAKGETRTGVDPDGHPWSVRMPAHYGEVPGTVGADGDPVDVFVGDDPFAPIVFVAQFRHAGTRRFDETKALLGFTRRADAERVLRAAYDRADLIQGITEWPIGAWAAALQRPDVSGGKMTRVLRKASLTLRVPR